MGGHIAVGEGKTLQEVFSLVLEQKERLENDYGLHFVALVIERDSQVGGFIYYLRMAK